MSTPELALQLSASTISHLYLQEVIPTFDMAVNEIFFERYPDSILEHQIQVRPFNALKTKSMRNLNPEGNIFNSRKCCMWKDEGLCSG